MKTFTFILFIAVINIQAQVSDFKHVNFTKADNLAKLYESESLKNVPLLTHNLTHSLKTDIEKFRAIYKWICANINGDHRLSQKILAKNKKLKNKTELSKEWQLSMLPKVFKKLRKQKRTMCTGYAYLLKYMSEIAGIKCKIIHGYARTATTNLNSFELINHSWNAVKINNKWYLCDPTWSSGYANESFQFIKDYNDGYFLTSPQLFSKNHFPLDETWLLNSNESSTSYLESPIIYNETFKHSTFPISPSKIALEIPTKQLSEFIFTSELEQSDSFDMVIEKGNLIKFISPKTSFNHKKKQVKLSYSLKNKGSYKLHVLFNNDIVSTYLISGK
ncbi:transglutaminase domain-containing protein [Tenacibaculum xiamenense]|uniref:transglutaminase domain-containing protein n=1 Tax=Tenacibaculum xiamenense TaxID=1261553 RepID=UPI0038B6321F